MEAPLFKRYHFKDRLFLKNYTSRQTSVEGIVYAIGNRIPGNRNIGESKIS
jgi:hypothetical protein